MNICNKGKIRLIDFVSNKKCRFYLQFTSCYKYICIDFQKNGSVAQLVEHDTLNVGVVGSIPTGTTNIDGNGTSL